MKAISDLIETISDIWDTAKHYVDPANTVPAVLDKTLNNKYAAGTAATIAGLYLARKIANRKKTKPIESDPLKDVGKGYVGYSSSEPLDWEKQKEKRNTISEQNENLPRFPELSLLRKINPTNPRSIAGINGKRKQNIYDTNAENKNIKSQEEIADNNIKKTKAQTGVDTTLGKLVA
jgi:hypothetical protein